MGYVGGATANTGGTTGTSLTVNYTPTTGNWVVLSFCTAGTVSAPTIQDNNLNILDFAQAGDTLLVWGQAIAGETSYKASWGTSRNASITIAEYSGITGVTLLGQQTKTGSSTAPSVALVSSSANSIVVASIALPVDVTYTAGTGNLRQSTQTTGCAAALVDNTSATAGTLLTCSATLSGSGAWDATCLELTTLSTFWYPNTDSATAVTSTVTGDVLKSATVALQVGSTVVCAALVQTTGTALTLSSVTDTAGNTWTVTPSSPSVEGAVQVWLMYTFLNAGGGNKQIEATFTAAPTAANFKWYINPFVLSSGATVSLDLDAAGKGTTGTTVNTPSITPSNTGELLFAFAYGTSISAINAPWISFGVVTGDPQVCYILDSKNTSTAMNMTQTSGAWASMILAIGTASVTLIPQLACCGAGSQ